jgi:hypothetical protein
MLFGMTAIASFCTQWALDAYRQHSTELFIMNMVFKNFVSKTSISEYRTSFLTIHSSSMA